MIAHNIKGRVDSPTHKLRNERMSDTERLNLIEHYSWKVYQAVNKSWQIGGAFGVVRRNSLREAIDEALSRQIKWALS